MTIFDPLLSPINRAIFSFNNALQIEVILEPDCKRVYKKLPSPIQTGIE